MDTSRNLELMQTLDDAWNTQDWDTFAQREGSTNSILEGRWPGVS